MGTPNNWVGSEQCPALDLEDVIMNLRCAVVACFCFLVGACAYSPTAFTQTIGQPNYTAQVVELKPADAEVVTSPLYDFSGKVAATNKEKTLSVEVRLELFVQKHNTSNQQWEAVSLNPDTANPVKEVVAPGQTENIEVSISNSGGDLLVQGQYRVGLKISGATVITINELYGPVKAYAPYYHYFSVDF